MWVKVPALIFWIFVALYLIGAVVVSLYSRYMKRKDKLYSSTKKNEATTINPQNVHPTKQNVLIVLFRRIKPYLYGLTRYYSIIVGKIPSHHVRVFLLKLLFKMNIDKQAVIYGGFEMRSPWNITIGASVIGVGALLDGRCGIEIGDDVTLAQNVSIFTLQHDLNDEMFRTNNKGGKVTIEKWAWISSNTTILPGVCVRTGAVLASGGIATKELDSYSVYGGIPARKIAERNHNLKYSLANNDYWHFY